MKCRNCEKEINVGDIIHEVPIRLFMDDDYDHEMIQICDYCYNLG